MYTGLRSTMFTHFFSFPENMKIPFELSLNSLPDFLTKVRNVLKFMTFPSMLSIFYFLYNRLVPIGFTVFLRRGYSFNALMTAVLRALSRELE